jgi:hypothetical protein
VGQLQRCLAQDGSQLGDVGAAMLQKSLYALVTKPGVCAFYAISAAS